MGEKLEWWQNNRRRIRCCEETYLVGLDFGALETVGRACLMCGRSLVPEDAPEGVKVVRERDVEEAEKKG